MKKLVLSLLAALALALIPAAALAWSLTVTWQANTESDLTGYKVYYGTASGQYGPPITVELGPDIPGSYQITGLRPRTRYWVALTAFNLGGFESGFSEEANARTWGPPRGCMMIAAVDADTHHREPPPEEKGRLPCLKVTRD